VEGHRHPRAGDVFTIEPGVHASTRLLDMLPDRPKNRAMIANDYAITVTGVQRLSHAPREVGEVEAAMAHRGR